MEGIEASSEGRVAANRGKRIQWHWTTEIKRRVVREAEKPGLLSVHVRVGSPNKDLGPESMACPYPLLELRGSAHQRPRTATRRYSSGSTLFASDINFHIAIP